MTVDVGPSAHCMQMHAIRGGVGVGVGGVGREGGFRVCGTDALVGAGPMSSRVNGLFAPTTPARLPISVTAHCIAGAVSSLIDVDGQRRVSRRAVTPDPCAPPARCVCVCGLLLSGLCLLVGSCGYVVRGLPLAVICSPRLCPPPPPLFAETIDDVRRVLKCRRLVLSA